MIVKVHNNNSIIIIPMSLYLKYVLIIIISYQHVLHFDVGRSQIEWNMKVKSEISVFT